MVSSYLVDMMRAYGPYIPLHFPFEKDMIAFSGCTHDLSIEEANELTSIRLILLLHVVKFFYLYLL
ncbi:hypothetical protein HanIR_Chr02g0059971 [Helianthus annuus]|nr:hypothetical protein HanIR_Chr02g0059971 [Helianthus annuus]